jgi:hypothetical protein
VGQVAGVAGDDGGLVADGGHDDDRVDDVGGPGGGAGDASGTAGGLVVGEDVAGLEYPEDLVPWTAPAAVSSATEGLGHAGAGGHATGWAQQTVTGN